MRIQNNILRTFRVPVPVFDRILELIALVLLLALLGLTTVLYLQAPEQIPIHFNWNDEPSKWADKAMYWYTAVFFVLLMLLSATSAYDFRFINLPVRLKEPVINVQKMYISRMSRFLTLCIGMMWLSYLLRTVVTFWNISFLARVFSKVSLFILFVLLIYYSVKIWWIGRNY